MEHLPINIDLRGRKVIVTGGITGSARKVGLALRAGAHVEVYALELGPDFHELVKNPALHHIKTRLQAKHIEGTALIFAACEEADEDKRIFDMARAAGVLVNVPDKLELCDFIMPAILDRSPLIISVSSAGASAYTGPGHQGQAGNHIPCLLWATGRFCRALSL